MSVLVLRFCALKLILKLISIADDAPSLELVRRRENRKYASSHTTVVRIASVFSEFFYILSGYSTFL